MAISQRSNLINVVVHNSADSRNASLSAIILSHVLIEGRKHESPSCLGAGPAEGGQLHAALQTGAERAGGKSGECSFWTREAGPDC